MFKNTNLKILSLLSEVAPGLLVIQIPIQAVWGGWSIMLFLLVFEVFYYVLFNMYLIFPLIINFRNCVDNHRYYCQFQSPEELRLAINNLSKADPKLHETRFDIKPHTGTAIKVSQRVIF